MEQHLNPAPAAKSRNLNPEMGSVLLEVYSQRVVDSNNVNPLKRKALEELKFKGLIMPISEDSTEVTSTKKGVALVRNFLEVNNFRKYVERMSFTMLTRLQNELFNLYREKGFHLNSLLTVNKEHYEYVDREVKIAKEATAGKETTSNS